MAAREHQGLQIALIIFVILTISLSVSTFMFANKLAEERAKLADADKSAKEANEKARLAEETANALKPIIGHPVEDTTDAIAKAFDDVKAKFAALTTKTADGKAAEGDTAKPAPDNSGLDYRKMVDRLFVHINTQEGRLAKAQDDLKTQAELVAKARAEGKAEAEKLLAGQKKAEEDREKVRADADAQVADTRKANASVEEVRKAAEERATKIEAAKTAEIKTVRDALAKTTTRANDLVKVLEEGRGRENTEVADGRVTWVAVSERVVYINLGRDDHLRPQVSFSVYSPDTLDLSNAKAKAKIEVTKIIGAHEAECRIVEDSITNPILPQDVVYSPVWHPGRKIHFALVGFMDIDGDGTSDKAKIKDLIRINGGVIDAEVDDEGKPSGKLSVITRYIVIGDRPTEKTGKQVLEAYSNMIGQAKQYGVQQMNVQQFLDMMGFKADERTIQLGKGADPRDFRAKAPAGAPRKPVTLDPFRKLPPAESKAKPADEE